jgi:hypothetical protein
MNAQHTPGPWKVREDYAGSMSVVSHDHFLARVGPPNTEQSAANARLIAAAPDLLEALREFVESFEGCYADGEPAMIKAQAAIAKATGAA